MAKSQETFNKKEKEKLKRKKKEEKERKKEERKANSTGGDLESMLMYVDENGNFTSTPPDPTKRTKVKAEDMQLGAAKRETTDADEGRKGKVSFFNESKGYGFIRDLTSQESIFVHINGLIDRVKEGDTVTFRTEKGPKGLNAISVKKA